MLRQCLHRHAHDYQQKAGHEHDGAQHRRSDDYPHPAGGGFIRAHCSTIASPFLPRKPYEQVRW
jgi:hypothetical protein